MLSQYCLYLKKKQHTLEAQKSESFHPSQFYNFVAVRFCNETPQSYFCKHLYRVFRNFCCITCEILVDLCCWALFGVTGLNVFHFFLHRKRAVLKKPNRQAIFQ